MIRVIVELIPKGIESRKQILGIATMTNDLIKTLETEGAYGDIILFLVNLVGKEFGRKVK